MKKELGKYFIFIVLIALVILSYKIISPYIIVLISSFILAYLVHPIYTKLSKRLNKNLSAMICILILILIILLPLGGIIGGIINQASGIVNNPNSEGFIQKIIELPIISKIPIDLADLIGRGTNILINLLSSALSYLPGLFISTILLIMAVYYILIDWDPLLKKLKNYLPKEERQETIKDISNTTRGLIYGTLLIAAIEFVVAATGFFLVGVNLYFLLPTLIFFLAFIPSIGPALVWVPLLVYYIILQNWYLAAGVLIIGLILSVVVDSIMRAKIMGKRSNANPLVILIGILGGISLFGIFGFIIGPLILIYTIKLLQKIVENR